MDKLRKKQMKALIKNGKNVAVKVVPELQISKSNEVKIKVIYAGICRTDIYVAQGKIDSISPLILGHEFSGIVTDLGTQVTKFELGDRVTVNPVITEQEGKCSTFLGIDRQGAFAEYVIVPEEFVYKLPDHVDFKEGAYTEPIAAALAIFNADIKPEQTGLIYGSNRIAKLTSRILQIYGFDNIDIYDTSQGKILKENYYDYIIEIGRAHV